MYLVKYIDKTNAVHYRKYAGDDYIIRKIASNYAKRHGFILVSMVKEY